MINKAISGFVVPAMVVAAFLVAPVAALASFGYGGGDSVTISVAPDPDGNQVGTVAGATTGTETTPIGDVILETPAGLQVTGPADWTGVITMPTVTTTTVAPVADPGKNATVVGSIEVGFADVHLTFNKAVRLAFAGQAGNSIGWSQGGVFHAITADCAATGGDVQASQNTNLLADSECKINVSGDLVVWTKHFSTFTTYTQASKAVTASSHGGGGGRACAPGTAYSPSTSSCVQVGATPAVPGVSPAIPARGRVLGASTFNFTRNLGVGLSGDDVTTLQQILIDADLLKIDAPTGNFGQLTKAAVQAFQNARGIANTGFVGPLTRGELNKGAVATSVGPKLNVSQASAIVGFLQSFDADQSIIDRVRTILGL